MKSLQILSKSSLKIKRGERELSEKDILEVPKGLIPGEWIYLDDKENEKRYVGYINPYAEIFFKIKIAKEITSYIDLKLNEAEEAKKIILFILESAIKKRKIFKDYENGSRLFFGTNDSLPGLIVDKYKKYIFIQINTAGIDRFREEISNFFQSNFQDHKIYFYDNVEYRKAEVLPIHEKTSINEDLEVVENNISYLIPKSILQKIGYYYDHRENRLKLQGLLSRLNINKISGLDLFSYVGSWGLHMLSAGIEHVTFVDQGDMLQAIKGNLELNGFNNSGTFVRSDVFKYLDLAQAEQKQFDVVVSDPPAFTKSEKNKHSAIQGYEKLHNKAIRLVSDNGLFIAASCTHYVSLEELDKTVQDAAYKNNLKIQMLDIGMQGFDHVTTGFKDKSYYIKYIAYLVNKG